MAATRRPLVPAARAASRRARRVLTASAVKAAARALYNNTYLSATAFSNKIMVHSGNG